MHQATTSPSNNKSMADLLYTILLLCKGVNAKDQPIWAYICIQPSMAKSFKIARDHGNVDIAEYGTVLDSGLGLEPPQEVRQRMEREYGINHTQAEEILNKMADINPEDFH